MSPTAGEQKDLTERYQQIMKLIRTVNPTAALLAVSKKQPEWKLRWLLEELGHTHFGENYLTELKAKMKNLGSSVHWTYLGRLQSSHWRVLKKAGARLGAVDHPDLIDWARASPPSQPVSCLIQVSVEPKEGRLGISPQEAESLAEKIAASPHFNLEGLLFMPLEERSLNERKIQFTDVARFFTSLKNRFRNTATLTTLSMGMSDDFVEALRAGATEVRIGTSLFGERIA